MRLRFASSFLLFLLAVCTAAGQDSSYQCRLNRWSGLRYSTTNYGIFGHDVSGGGPGLFFPWNTLRSYLYGSGLYFAGRKEVDDTLRNLVFITYNPNSGASWARPGEYPGIDAQLGAPILYYIGDYSRATGINMASPSSPRWPLWLPPGRSEKTHYPGEYVLDTGRRTSAGTSYSRPAFMEGVTEQWVSRFHDGDLSRYEGWGDASVFPIGLQFQQNVYSWLPELRYGNVVVLQYEIVNVSGDTLRDCHVGQGSDPDIGSASNDRVGAWTGTDGKVRAALAYTQAETVPGYGMLAQVLLEAPSTSPDGYIDNAQRVSLGFKHEITSFRDWTLTNDPVTLADKFDFITRPGLDSDSTAGDKRILISVGPFTMRPGDTAHFTVAFAVFDSTTGRINPDDIPGSATDAGLDLLIRELVDDYVLYQRFRTSVPGNVAGRLGERATLTVAPNPVAESTRLQFDAVGGPVVVSFYDALGSIVRRSALGSPREGPQSAVLDCADLAGGTYTLRVDGVRGGTASTRLTVLR